MKVTKTARNEEFLHKEKVKYTRLPERTATHIQPNGEEERTSQSITTRTTTQHVKQRQIFNKSKLYSPIRRKHSAET